MISCVPNFHFCFPPNQNLYINELLGILTELEV